MRARILAKSLGFALASLLALGTAAQAQTDPTPPPVTLPSISVGTAALVRTSSADSYYPTRTVNATPLATLEGKGSLPPPPEIVELARALKNNPDLIYEYVRNNINVNWMYGLSKGPLGALIDRSGTPFDQAALMIALLNQSGYSANYLAGTITLTGAQFTAWTGISDSNAACQMLANGGIPAVINGTNTNHVCASGTGSAITSVRLSHVWVQVTIGAQQYVFDPAYKTYAKWTGIDLVSAAQIGTGANSPLSIATNGIATGSIGTGGAVPTASGFKSADLNTALTGYSQNLLNYLYAHNLQTAHMEDVAGGGVIVPYVSPPGGLRQTTLPYTNAIQHTWSCALPQASLCNVPNTYRTTLHVQGYVWNYHCTDGVTCPGVSAAYETAFDAPFFADEIYGRAVTVDTDISASTYYNDTLAGPSKYANGITLHVDGVAIGATYLNPGIFFGHDADGFPVIGTSRNAPSYVTLTIDHPYAASATPTNTTTQGTYMDAATTKSVRIVAGLTIVEGLGDASGRLLAKWSDEKNGDSAMPYTVSSCYAEDPPGKCLNAYPGGTGDFEREKLAANWLAQYSTAAHLDAAVAGATYQLHHMIGVSYGDALLGVYYQQNPPLGENPDFPIADNYNRLDVDSGLSMQSRAADPASRRAAILTFAAAAATLEGSAAAQTDDLPDMGSTAARFEWANTPPGSGYWDAPLPTSPNAYEDPGNPGPRKFVQYTSANASHLTEDGVILIENLPRSHYTDPHCTINGLPCGESCTAADQPTIGDPEATNWSLAYSNEVSAYTTHSYVVVSSQEAFLGPGQRASGDIRWTVGKNGSTGAPFYGPYIHSPTKQRGPAFVATLYDPGNGVDPLQIAHDLVALGPYGEGSIVTKGGGGGSQPNQSTSYNPSEAGDILKSHFVDKSNLLGVNLSNGTIGYTAPAKLSVGNGGFPYELSASFEWSAQPTQPGNMAPMPPVNPSPGWASSWQSRLSLSGSGMEAMGQSDVRAAVGSIAVLLAAQSIYANNPAMSRDVSGLLAFAWWARQMSGNTVTAQLGTQSRQFLALPDGVTLPGTSAQWFAPGPSFASLTIHNARAAYEQKCTSGQVPGTPYAASRGWNYSGGAGTPMSFDVTSAQGDVQHYAYWSNKYSMEGEYECGFAQGFRLASWTFPQGAEVDLHYGNKIDYQRGGAIGSDGFDQLVSVTNSIGREIDFATDGFKVVGMNNHLSGSDARSVSLGDFTGYQTGGFAGSVTDAASNKTSFAFLPAQARSDTQRPVAHAELYQIYTPDNPTKPNLQYNFDTVGRVKQVVDAENLQRGDRAPWSFFIADGTRGERDDPLNEAWSVTYDVYGHPARYIDERGYETDDTSDNRGQVLTRVYPEGDCEVFAYDDRGNTTDYYRVDKTSSCSTSAGSSHVLHVSAQWDPAWNKPTQIADANGNVTTIAYYASGAGASLIHTATRPADASGNHPVYSFDYDDAGKVENAYVPFTPSQTIRTHYDYDSSENLTETSVDPDNLNLTTSYTYDANGDTATVTDARDYLTETKFDNDRQPTYTIHHDGSTTSAAINAESRIVYDALERDVEEDVVKCFNTASPCLSSGTTAAVWVATKKITYTPTSKVATVTDADNQKSATTYDPADRPNLRTDPAMRQVAFSYDPAGNVLTETRGLGTQDQAVYATYTYGADGEKISVTDALGATHATAYGYDGFNRLNLTTYPDGSTEQVTLYDADGNIKTRVNRANETFTYTYDNLNRMLTKVMPAVTGVNPQVTTSWTYYQNGAVADLSDTAGNDLNTSNSGSNVFFDTAGRLVRTDTTIPGITGALSTNYELDDNGNRTKLTWPDGYYATYGYDSLNRMTLVKESGSVQLASYVYDAMSRRTSMAYRAGMSSTYAYTDAGDMTSLVLATGSGSVPSYAMTYASAHQLASEATTPSSYMWQPAASGTDTYAAVNNLNQYTSWTPSGGTAKSFSYDGNGNTTAMTASGVGWTFAYDPENRLLTANKAAGGVAASYAYDPLGRRNHKSGVGVTETYFVDDSTDEIAEYNASGALSLRYVPGLAINQPIASISSTGARRFIQFDHQGSVIAVATNNGTESEGPYVYDSYGNGAPTTGIALKYVGMRLDPETGLYYDRARYYCSTCGRFLQPDPVGYTADLNLYPYTNNDPLNKVDPSGNLSDVNGTGQAAVESQRILDAPEGREAQTRTMAVGIPLIAVTGAAAACGGGACAALGAAALGNAPAITTGVNAAADFLLTDALGGSSLMAGGGLAAAALNGAREEAGAVRATGETEGAAGAVATRSGKVYPGRSSRAGGPGGATNARVQKALDNVPLDQRSPYHGKCCEIDAFSNAINAGDQVEGAVSAAVRVKTDAPMGPCSSCSAVTKELTTSFH